MALQAEGVATRFSNSNRVGVILGRTNGHQVLVSAPKLR